MACTSGVLAVLSPLIFLLFQRAQIGECEIHFVVENCFLILNVIDIIDIFGQECVLLSMMKWYAAVLLREYCMNDGSPNRKHIHTHTHTQTHTHTHNNNNNNNKHKT